MCMGRSGRGGEVEVREFVVRASKKGKAIENRRRGRRAVTRQALRSS